MFGAAVAISRLHFRTFSFKCDDYILSRAFKQYPLQKFVNFYNGKLPQVSRSFCNWKPVSLNGSWRANIIGWNQNSRQTLFKSNVLKRFMTTRINFKKDEIMRVTKSTVNPLTVNTNIKNNVMLFRHEKDGVIRLAFIFGIISVFACLFMADNVYLLTSRDLFNQSIPLKDRLINNIFPISAITVAFIAGPLIFGGICFYISRCIKYIILHKGGKSVTIITYHPLKKIKRMTIPVNHVNCQIAREDIKSYVTLKIKDKKYRYMCDKSGHFVNPELFDSTVGTSRNN